MNMCYRFDSKSPTSLQLTASPKKNLIAFRDRGIPKNQNDDQIRRLAGHILKIIQDIELQRWNDAITSLLDGGTAKFCGFRIDSPFEVFRNIDDAVHFTRMKATWFQSNKKIRLPLVAIGGKGSNSLDWKYPAEISDLAEKIFPILLEEWIHAFQFMISSPICDESILFGKSPQFKKSWNINEVDVFALYRKLGWNVEMLHEMEIIYDERVAFVDFSNNNISSSR